MVTSLAVGREICTNKGIWSREPLISFKATSELTFSKMESIKHKMAVLAQETEIANQRGREATAAAQAQEEKAENFEHEVLNAQKKVLALKFWEY